MKWDGGIGFCGPTSGAGTRCGCFPRTHYSGRFAGLYRYIDGGGMESVASVVGG